MTKPTSVDAYLAALPAEQRKLLERVRKQIKAVAKGAEEYLGYGLVGFKLNGRPLIYLGAAKHHCALYGARSDDALADKLAGFKQTKGSIHFTAEQPIPAGLLKEIVLARMAANEQRATRGASRKTPKKAAKSSRLATKKSPRRTTRAR